MSRLRRMVRPALRFSLATAGLLLLAACAKDAPQDALSPDGPLAKQADSLFRPVFWIAAAIFFIVEGLIIVAIVKFRDRGTEGEPKQVHGNTKLELTWTLIPALILFGVAIPTVATIFEQVPRHKTDEVRVKVVGHQWWWEYQYPDLGVTSANELVIPAGRQVFLELESADVIHSFWVPKLAGKQDVVPGRTNTMVLVADRPDTTYFGQCAEFCAISHANMRLRVHTKTAAGFEQWVASQKAPAAEPAPGSDAARGRDLFMANACIQCHAIQGTEAAGKLGPDLTHLMDRDTHGSALYDNTPENLFEWVKHARDRKPGVVMPNFDRELELENDEATVSGFKVLSDAEIRLIVAYLLTLL